MSIDPLDNGVNITTLQYYKQAAAAIEPATVLCTTVDQLPKLRWIISPRSIAHRSEAQRNAPATANNACVVRKGHCFYVASSILFEN